MTVAWGDWHPFEDAVGRPLHLVDRTVARRYFDLLMGARPERRKQLEALLRSNRIAVSTDDEGLQALNDWYRASVEASPQDPARLSARWYAIGLDIGLHIGEAIIERAPTIEWRLFTHGRKDLAYHRPVLMGFSGVPNPKYNVDPELLVGTHGHRLTAGMDEPSDLFVQIVRNAVARA